MLLCVNRRQCFGDGTNGMLGNGGTATIGSDQTGDAVPDVDLGTDFYAVALSTGDGLIFHHCALSADASLLCWGSNAFGRLGVGDTVDRTTPVTPQIHIYSTASPTALPSQIPTSVTSAPTTQPTIEPSRNPSLVPTIEPTFALNATQSWIDQLSTSEWIVVASLALGGLIALILCIVGCVWCRWCDRAMMAKMVNKAVRTRESETTAMKVKKAMVVVAAIGHYDKKPRNPAAALNAVGFSNLDVVRVGRRRLHHLVLVELERLVFLEQHVLGVRLADALDDSLVAWHGMLSTDPAQCLRHMLHHHGSEGNEPHESSPLQSIDDDMDLSSIEHSVECLRKCAQHTQHTHAQHQHNASVHVPPYASTSYHKMGKTGLPPLPKHCMKDYKRKKQPHASASASGSRIHSGAELAKSFDELDGDMLDGGDGPDAFMPCHYDHRFTKKKKRADEKLQVTIDRYGFSMDSSAAEADGEKGARTLSDDFSDGALVKHAWEKRDDSEKLRLCKRNDVMAMVLLLSSGT